MPAPWTLEFLLAEITNLGRNTLDFREPQALAAVERDPEGAKKKLFPLLDHPERAVEYRAGILLLHLRAPDGISWLFMLLATEPRAALVELAHGTRHALPIETLEACVLPHLATANADLAIDVLARYGTPRSADALRQCLRHDDRRVREVAISRLVMPNIRELSSAELSARVARIQAGESVDPPLAIAEEVVDAIVGLLEDEDFSFALRALQQVMRRAPPAQAQRAVSALASRLESALSSRKKRSSPMIEATARHALAVVHDALGLAAQPLLEKAAKCALPQVRREAAERLARAGGDAGKRQVLAGLADPALATSSASAILVDPDSFRDEAAARAVLGAIRAEIPRSRRRAAIAERLRKPGAPAKRPALIAELVALQGGSLRTLASAYLAISGPDATRALAKLAADLPVDTRMRLKWIDESLTLRIAVARLTEAGLRVAGHDGTGAVDDPASAVMDLIAGSGRFVYLDTEAPRVPPDYETLVEDFAAASAGAFAPREIDQPMELVADGEDRRVRFRCGNETFSFEAKTRGDCYDVDAALVAIHAALTGPETFVELLPDGQVRRFVFVDDAAFRKAAAMLHLPLPARARTRRQPAKRNAGARKQKGARARRRNLIPRISRNPGADPS